MAWSHKGISLDAAPPLAWLDNGNGLEPAMRMFAQTPGICGCAKAAQHRSRCRRATPSAWWCCAARFLSTTATSPEAQFVLLDRTGGEVTLKTNNDATVLIPSGEPINEPVVMHGPSVMNTADEIRQATVDFQSGRFGAISAEP
jgi:hypothetical protein